MQGGLLGAALLPPVAEELSLSDEQAEKIRSMAEEVRSDMSERMRGARGQLADLTPDERRQRMEQMTQETDETVRARLKDILEEGQLARLEQIHLQQQGPQAFGNPRVLEQLNLDDDQRSKLDELLQSHRDKVTSLMADARDAGDRTEVMRDMMELRRSVMEEAHSLLTEEQQATWSELTGEPFQMGPGGVGRGRTGPGGQPGAGGRPGPGRRPGPGGRPGR